MAGARFLRADLHVHTFPDNDSEPTADLADYIEKAIDADVAVLGITDHNTTVNVDAAIAAAEGTGILVLPGLEISTHQGHLLALFAPSALSALNEFSSESNLRLSSDPK